VLPSVPADRRARVRRLMLVRLAFLVPLLVAVFALHVSGTALVVIRIVRIVVIGLAVLIAGGLRARRARAPHGPED
jgi:hypothetical protein